MMDAAHFYGEGVKNLKYAAQIEVVGGTKKSKLILKAWAEREDALTGFYHGILDELEKRVQVKGYIDDNIVQNFYHYGDNIGTQVRDSFVYKSNVGADAKKNGVHVKEHIDDSTVQNLHHHGDNIGTQVKDSLVQRSNIGTGAGKCPNCGREVDANEKFCLECGTKL